MVKKSRLGWFRVEEAAIQQLMVSFDKPADTRNAMLCYLVLCRKVNLKKATTFEDTIRSMACDMCMVYRDAQKALQLVESTGLLQIERRKIPRTNSNAPSVYTVLKPSDIMSEGSRRDVVTDESRSFTKSNPKNDKKTSAKKHCFEKQSTSFSETPKNDVFLSQLKEVNISEERQQFIRKFNEYAKLHSHALLPIDVYTEELDRALNVHEDNSFVLLFEAVTEEVGKFDGTSGKRLTLVRIVWENH